jgi:uncharacterized repeat protein (TIGR03847 family)
VSRSFELDPVERITAGAIGEPGDRTFFVQASGALEQISVVAEKEQVRALAQGLLQLLAAVSGEDDGDEPSPGDLDLRSPLEPEWRAGEMAIEYEQEADRIVILITEAVLEGDDDDEPEIAIADAATARFVATRAQAHAMATRALEVVSSGRPRCQLCGMPINEGEEHICPAMNGHRK